MTTTEETTEHRLPTRQLLQPDLPEFDPGALDDKTRDALAELLLTMADDEFICGFWDSEWTGIAPMLEEDVAWSSIAQDEIGHARLLYEMLGRLTGQDPDRIAFHRQPAEYRHASLIDHPRTDWAFSIARRWMYEYQDALRLGALASSSFKPLADVVGKIRREERYHLMHVDTWLRRLAKGGPDSRSRLQDAMNKIRPDAHSVLTPLANEKRLIDAGILAEPFAALQTKFSEFAVKTVVDELGFEFAGEGIHPGNRDRSVPSESFLWLWGEFTSVARMEEGVTW
jgi:ring-1,2-phenylacetyl-CoA epoxidase subunit PaaC